MDRFRHPVNGHIEEISGLTWLWAFLFGLFFFMYKGIWRHVLIQLLAIVILYAAFGPPATMFVAVMWIAYACMAHGIVEKSLLRAGYFAEAEERASWEKSAAASSVSPTDESYALAMSEWDSPAREAGLWARVYAQSQGDEAKAKAAYIAERAKVLTIRDRSPLVDSGAWAANEPLPQPPPRN